MPKGVSVLTGKLTRRTVLRTMGAFGLGAAGLGLAGCTTTTTTVPPTISPTVVPTTTPVRGGTFNFSTLGITQPDPRYGEAFVIGYYAAPFLEPLLSFDLDWNTVGVLAEDMRKIDDVTYRFNLRHGVKFHDGTDFTATDAKANILFCANLIPGQTKHRYVGFYNKITGADIIDSYTLDVHLSEPWAYSIMSLPLLNPTYILKDADTRSTSPIAKPIGTGPYKLTEYVEGSHYRYARFDDWWGEGLEDFWTGEQYFDTLLYKVITDESARLVELQNRTIDCMYYQDNSTHTLVKADANLSYAIHSDFMMEVQRFNVRKLPASDKRFREAVLSAVDYEAVVETIHPKDMPVDDMYVNSPYEDANLTSYLPKYDVQHAKDLVNELKAAGVPLTIDYPCTTGTACTRTETIASYLVAVGIQVNVKPQDTGAWNSTTRNGLFDVCEGKEMIPAANVWVFDYTQFYSLQGYSAVDGGNCMGIKDSIMDQKILNMMKSTDPTVIHDDAVAVGQRAYQMNYLRPMFLENRTYAYSNKVHGFDGDGSFRRGFPIADVWKSA